MGTEAWSTFDTRANLSDNNNPQVMILDTTLAAANQNQRTPVTQFLRSGMNFLDIGNLDTAITNLGATSASTANSLMRRNASGVTNVSTLTVDGASAPAVNIGVANTLSMGTATGSNQFFTGTVSGDTCIRSSNTGRQLLLGVGAGNAQFAVLNTHVLSNTIHRFTAVGANRMPFTDANTGLTGSANYTVNGTGGLTITQGFTAATGTFSGGTNAVSITGNAPSMIVGPNTNYAASSANNQFFNPALTGDTCIRNTSTSNFVRIGVGSSNAQLIIGNTSVLLGVNANITATNQALTFDSANQVTLGKASASNIFFTGTVSGDGALNVANTSNSLHLGVGSASAQLVISNTQVSVNSAFACSGSITGGAGASFPGGTVSAITFTGTLQSSAIGTNRMPYSDASNNLISSANYTVNGTGGLTITQTLTAGGASFSGDISVASTNQALYLGFTSRVLIGKASASNIFFTGTVANDGAISAENSANSLHIGVGSATAQQIIKNLEVDFNVGIKLPTSGGTASSLDYYEDTIHATTLSGAASVSSQNILIVRIGSNVSLELPTWAPGLAASSAVQVTDTPLPARFRPQIDVYFVYGGTNGTESLMLGRVATTGVITWFGGQSSTSTYTSGSSAAAKRSLVPAYTI